jgi:hypothetical protein
VSVAHAHPHERVHNGVHDHVHPVREEPAQDVGANPVLDIGGDVGALVVVLAGQTPSGELEACPITDPAARFHTGVHRRGEGDLAAWTAVFPAVVQGHYHLLQHDGAPMAAVAVTGGQVETIDLR